VEQKGKSEMNPIKTYAEMALEHVCTRLMQLADHRTPAVIDGLTKATCPVPMHEWALLREAAARLQRLAIDLESHRRTARGSDNWPHWALVGNDGKIIESTSLGKRQIEAMATRYREAGFDPLSFSVRPLMIGGCNAMNEAASEVQENADA
jgi:hypothetical protein